MDEVFIEKGLQTLENLLKEEEQNDLRQKIAKLVEIMGFNACSKEIEMNRRSKDNAIYALKHYYKDIIGDRTNPITREVFKIPQETIEKADKFKEIFMQLVNKLENNTENQLKYLELKRTYSNETFKMSAMYEKFNQFMDGITERNEKTTKELEEHNQFIKEQQKRLKDAENALDEFVLNNIG